MKTNLFKSLLFSLFATFIIFSCSKQDDIKIKDDTLDTVASKDELSDSCLCITYVNLRIVQGKRLRQGDVIDIAWDNSYPGGDINRDIIRLVNQSGNGIYIIENNARGEYISNNSYKWRIPLFIPDGSYTLQVYDANRPTKSTSLSNVSIGGNNSNVLTDLILSPRRVTTGLNASIFARGSVMRISWKRNFIPDPFTKVRVFIRKESTNAVSEVLDRGLFDFNYLHGCSTGQLFDDNQSIDYKIPINAEVGLYSLRIEKIGMNNSQVLDKTYFRIY